MATSATVLFVDDDPSVLEIGRTLVGRLGYTVITASFPNEALSICRALPTKLDCLITDIGLPGMDGWTVASLVQDLHPEARVLYVTGDPESANLLRRKELPWLAKPFRSDELETALNHLLREETP